MRKAHRNPFTQRKLQRRKCLECGDIRVVPAKANNKTHQTGYTRKMWCMSCGKITKFRQEE